MKQLQFLSLLTIALLFMGCSNATIDKITQGDGYFDLDNPRQGCTIIKKCGDLVSVDCGIAADGPFYYVDKNTNKIISDCGGLRIAGENTDICPPTEWTCTE